MQIETHEKSAALISPCLEPLDVLIADDEPSICETLQIFLQHLGIRNIQTVSNGALAVRQMSARHFDFVFVDLMMPEMSGLDVLKRVSDDLQLTNVIIMTGYPSMEIVIDAMHNGASDFLIKPFRFEDVKLSLEKILRLRTLMERNLLLHRELEKKKEVEALNNELQKRIRLQTILYHITDSLSKITRSENLYSYVVKQAVESCCARKACFLIYDQGNSHLLALAQ
jgi:DNA-binding NtrC family response regulator